MVNGDHDGLETATPSHSCPAVCTSGRHLKNSLNLTDPYGDCPTEVARFVEIVERARKICPKLRSEKSFKRAYRPKAANLGVITYSDGGYR